MLETRLMTKQDIQDVLKISNTCFKGNESWDAPSLEAELINHLSHNFVIIDDKQVCGFANVWIIAGEANINSIAIDEILRGKGLGTSLLKCILKYCTENNCNEIMLEVRESNTTAQNYYKKQNFIIEGERKKYYSSNGETAILMGNRDIKSSI